jgi:alkylhydroperoxidase family enzyme
MAQSKLDALAGWRVSAHFSAERAALAWAESVTDIAASHAEDDVYLPLLEHFSARQISDLTFAISLMNAFNRLAVSMRL